MADSRKEAMLPRFNAKARQTTPRLRRWVVFMCCLLALFTVYWYLNRHGLRWYAWPYKWDAKFVKLQCERPKEYREALGDLARSAYRSFDKLGVTSFLLYGSLFGALRYRGPIPWDEDVDFGVVGETISRYSLKDLQEAFKKEGVQVHFESWGGLYKLSKGGVTADVMVFYNSYGGQWMYRNGWEAYLLFINYWYDHVFPKRLLEPPLPKIEFAGMMMNMTHGRYKIQSYHFKDDWNIEVRPPGCDTARLKPTVEPKIVTQVPEKPEDYL